MGLWSEQPDAADDSVAALRTGNLIQAVVLATSRLIYRQPLSEREHQALKDCGTLLRWATTSSAPAPHLQELAGTANALSVMRKARPRLRIAEADLNDFREVISQALGGTPLDDHSIDIVRKLRTMFIQLGEINLEKMSRAGDSKQASNAWTFSNRSSSS